MRNKMSENGTQIETQNKRTIEMNVSEDMSESVLSALHQIRYLRWQANDTSFKVNSMDWNQSGAHLIVSSEDKTVRIFDLNGEEVAVIPSKKHGSDLVQWSNDSNTAVFASKYESNNGSEFHKIRHLDINAKTFLHYYCGHEKQVTSISVNRSHNCFLSSSLDNTIRFWDSRLEAHIKPGDRMCFGILKTLNRSVATFDPLGVVFAVCLPTDNSIRLYDMRMYERGPFKLNKLQFEPSVGEVHGIRFAPNGKMLALTTNGTKMPVIDAFTLQEISLVQGFKNGLRSNLDVTWTPDSKYVYSGSSDSFAGPGNYGNLNLMNALNGSLIKSWKTMHESFTQLVKFNPIYYMIASACHDISYWTPTSETSQ